MANTYSSETFSNSSLKGVGAGNFAVDTISTGTVNIGTGDTYTFKFAYIPGLNLVGFKSFINGTFVPTTAPIASEIITASSVTYQGITKTAGYSIVVTMGTVTATGVATVGVVAYYG